MSWSSADDNAFYAQHGHEIDGSVRPAPKSKTLDEQAQQRMYAFSLKLADQIKSALCYRKDSFGNAIGYPRYDDAVALFKKGARLAEYCADAQRGDCSWRSAEAMYEDVSGDQLSPDGTPTPLAEVKMIETRVAGVDRVIPLGKIA